MSTTSAFVHEDDVIQGEKFQQLAALYLGYADDFAYNPLIAKEKHKQGDLRTLHAAFANPAVIFCYTHRIGELAQKLALGYFRNAFTLITHNSDGNIKADDPAVQNILAQPLVKKWFAQNVGFLHNKLEILPIGLANRRWPHGNVASLVAAATAAAARAPKPNFIYFNFSISTNRAARQKCYDELMKQRLPWVPHTKDIMSYHRTLATYQYCICPEGNGYDTHRLWEALYLKCTPIVLRNAFIDVLRTKMPNLPLVVLEKSWADLPLADLPLAELPLAELPLAELPLAELPSLYDIAISFQTYKTLTLG